MAFAAKRPEAGIWGGRTLFADGSLNPTSCWRFMSLWSLFAQATGLTALGRQSALLNPEGYGAWRRDFVREVDIVTGCLLLIRRELWDRLEGFDESFFMYGEEADLCYRARRVGARPLLTPEVAIIHYDGASDRVLSAKMTKLLSGKIRLMKKHWPKPKYVVGVFLLKLMVLTRMLGIAAIARATGSSDRYVAAKEWRQVWLAKDRWSSGYQAIGQG
jgi:GT2 family glycosyltransferase